MLAYVHFLLYLCGRFWQLRFAAYDIEVKMNYQSAKYAICATQNRGGAVASRRL